MSTIHCLHQNWANSGARPLEPQNHEPKQVSKLPTIQDWQLVSYLINLKHLTEKSAIWWEKNTLQCKCIVLPLSQPYKPAHRDKVVMKPLSILSIKGGTQAGCEDGSMTKKVKNKKDIDEVKENKMKKKRQGRRAGQYQYNNANRKMPNRPRIIICIVFYKLFQFVQNSFKQLVPNNLGFQVSISLHSTNKLDKMESERGWF